METNETMKATLWREAEAAVQQVLEKLQAMKEGDLKVVEEHVLTTCQEAQFQVELLLDHLNHYVVQHIYLRWTFSSSLLIEYSFGK